MRYSKVSLFANLSYKISCIAFFAAILLWFFPGAIYAQEIEPQSVPIQIPESPPIEENTPESMPALEEIPKPDRLKKPPMIISSGICGNGNLEIGEDCDDGNTDPGDECRPDCTLARCGDGVFDIGEDCESCEEDCQEQQEALRLPIKKRSPAVALGLSLGGTLASYTLLTTGIVFTVQQKDAGVPLLFLGSLGTIVTPGLGHMYAGEGNYAGKSMLARLLCAGVVTGSLLILANTEEAIEELVIGAALGTLGFVFSTGLDIYDAPKAAKRAREGRANPLKGPFSLLPGPMPSNPGSSKGGLGLWAMGRF